MRISPLNSQKLVAALSSLGKLFHTWADSNLNDFCPYVTVLTVGILIVFSYLKEYFACFTSTKSLRYSGVMLLIHLYVSVAMHLIRSCEVLKDSVAQKALIARSIFIKNNPESSVLKFF